MMRLIHALVASLLTVVSLCSSVQAREISMLGLEWAPHYGPDLPEQGLTTALVKAAFNAVGYGSEVNFVPWARALKEVENGDADVVMGAPYDRQRAQTFLYSKPIYYLKVGLIAGPGLKISSFESLRDLQSYTIGVSRDFDNSEEFDAAEYLDKDVAAFPSLNIRKLYRGRIDIAAMNFDQFRFKAREEGFCICDVTFLEPILSTKGLHLIASRKIDDGEEIIRNFNRGLELIRESGQFDEIVNRLSQ